MGTRARLYVCIWRRQRCARAGQGFFLFHPIAPSSGRTTNARQTVASERAEEGEREDDDDEEEH